MATYRCSIKVISRGKGQSAVASAAYRAREKLKDERRGKTHDYTRKTDLVHAEIILPAGAPERWSDRATLWNEIERIEKRRDAQLARDVEISLPRELTREQHIDLVRGIAREFVHKGMVADFAIHDRGTGNPHAHMLLTLRDIDGDGFGKKNRDWNSHTNADRWREMVAREINQSMERNNHPQRVDHRSYERQGDDRIPFERISRVAWEMEERGIRTFEGDRRRQIEADNRRVLELKAERAQVVRELEGLTAPSPARQRYDEATAKALRRTDPQPRRYRKPTVSEPQPRQAAREHHESDRRQARNRRTLYGDRLPPAREPAPERTPEPGSTTHHVAPRRFEDIFDNLPQREQNQPEQQHEPETPPRRESFEDLFEDRQPALPGKDRDREP